ncbi:hypothetical protein PBY51_015471 [Eleginops maclovinus]|uniref:Rab-GAP TBC domain-containing protein n=1 Tax=Eleginops maclovinus TaxID=56733 RepID=A0AAN8AFT8_ELEMC|nr:hypothetical protein PBY51_015471 [Eleginops maclovinus]
METPVENGGVDLNENEGGYIGGQDTGKGHIFYVTGNGRHVNGGKPASQNRDIMLDLEYLPPGRGVISGVLNGFTESPEEPRTVMGEGEEGEEGQASCPGENRDVTLGEDAHVGGDIRDPLQCTGKHHLQTSGSSTGSSTGSSSPNMQNGGVENSHPDAEISHSNLGFCNVECEEEEEEKVVANGGVLHNTCDFEDKNTTNIGIEQVAEQGNGAGLGVCSQSECTGTLGYHSPVEDVPTAAELPPSSPSLSLEDFSELSLPVRPQSLRTNPNLVVSLSCDATPLSPVDDDDDDEGGFYFGDEEDIRSVLDSGRRQSAPDKLPNPAEQTESSESRLMPKRFGIAEFFTRSLFSRKAKEPKAASHNATGWRLFSKPATREEDPTSDPESTPCTQEEDQDVDPQLPSAAGRRKNLEFEPLSTTALILEDRPANLPAKSLEETQRHKMEYDEMVAGAKRREMKEAQRKKRQMKERHRQEDSISNAMIVWNTEILPHWDTMKATRRVRDLWWQGLPPSVRGRVWSLAIGNELNITPELYEIFLSRAKEKWRSYSETSSVNDNESDGASLADRESSLDLIKLDISRTFPSLFIFQKGGPYHDLLHSVLGAYTCYRPDIGYVQGMSFIAAVLILNLEEAEAFITFANLLNKPCQMAFFRVDHELMLKYFAAFEVFFEENLPRLFNHFQDNNLTPDLYLIDWIFTLYSKSLPLDVACRVWDVFCRDGEESLFRTGLGILRLFEEVLLQMDFIHIAQFLTRLPEDLQPHTLFTAMANTHMISRNRRWAQVFSALMKDGIKETDKNSSPALRS